MVGPPAAPAAPAPPDEKEGDSKTSRREQRTASSGSREPQAAAASSSQQQPESRYRHVTCASQSTPTHIARAAHVVLVPTGEWTIESMSSRRLYR